MKDTEDGPYLRSRWSQRRHGVPSRPSGRATSMPLAAVLTVPSGQQGQRKGGLELHSSPTSQVMIAYELAWEQGSRLLAVLDLETSGTWGEACIGLAVPGRPIRSLVAEDRSAGGVHDRTGPEPPMLTRLLTGQAVTPRDARVQDGTTLRHPPSLKAWWRPGEHRPAHRVGNLGPGARPLERPKSGPRTPIRCLYCRILAL
jgi:hypothetical protein